MTPSTRLHALLHLVTGGGCVLAAVWIWCRPDAAVHWQLLEEPLLATGLMVLLLGSLRRRAAIARFSSRVCLAVLSVVMTVAALELGFRVSRYDFRGREAARRQLPPFYRKPMVPTGGAFFRRHGPDSWTGQPIRTCLRALRLPDGPYQDEPVVTVYYDVFGFRNENRPPEWEVAVAGDSFTELGFLPHEHLFTVVLGRLTGMRVLNLGVSHTGPLTQLSYLRDYGLSPATRHLVIVFYEGNDLADLDREQLAVKEFERTGRYEPEEFRRQPSLLKAIADWVGRPPPPPVPEAIGIDAFWAAPTGEVALTFEDSAPAVKTISPETLDAFATFLSQYAKFARDHGALAWLAYMPCKLRVFYGRVRLTPEGANAVGRWEPTDLPQRVAADCARFGISFVDLTPPLTEALDRDGTLPFNPIYDTHLSAAGSEIVGRALAQAFKPKP